MADLTVAYRDLGLGDARPYLVLAVTGPGGQSGLIAGLIDTGADGTVLPAGYAPLMGYTPADLAAEQGSQVGGSVTIYKALKPASAFVPELPTLMFELNPCFVQGCQTPLWGRSCLMRQFDITIMETRQLFELTKI